MFALKFKRFFTPFKLCKVDPLTCVILSPNSGFIESMYVFSSLNIRSAQ